MNTNSKNRVEKNDNEIVEYVGFHYESPHPYKLKTVYMYRFVSSIGEFLIRLNDNQEISSGLAENWIISADRRKITFKIRKGGFSAYDVAESLKRLVSYGQTAHSNLAMQTSVEKINALSDDLIEIETYDDAGSIIRPLLMADTVIVPDRFWKKDSLGNEFVDWKSYNGKYVWESGGFKSQGFDFLKLIPNKRHYSYNENQLNWVIKWLDFNKMKDPLNVKNIFNNENSFLSLSGAKTIKLHEYLKDEVPFYETKPNGVHLLLPNLNSDVFKRKESRRYLLKKVFSAKLELNNPRNRALQIPQPGLSGRLNNENMKSVFSEIESFKEVQLERTVKIRVPDNPMFNTEWVNGFMKQLGIPFEILVIGSHSEFKRLWENGEVDLQLVSIGMSDTDPISGASFLFSENGLNADNENGDILKIINEAKSYSEEKRVNQTLQNAFKVALLEALAIPIYYTNNRHYYSQNITLNINDIYSESVSIDRIKVVK